MKKQIKCNVPGFCNLYVTKEGKAFKIQTDNSLRELKIGYRSNSKRNGSYIKPSVSVRVKGNKRNSRCTLSRLVALAWVPNPEKKPCVCHKDNNPQNNHYKNLYWGTAKENTQQCIRDGRFKFSDTKLSRPDILQLLYEYDTGMIKAKLARKYGISPMLVYKYIKKRKRYEKDFERTHSMEG